MLWNMGQPLKELSKSIDSDMEERSLVHFESKQAMFQNNI